MPALPEAAMKWRRMLRRIARIGVPHGRYGDVEVYALKTGGVGVQITDQNMDMVHVLQLSPDEARGIANKLVQGAEVASKL